MAGVIGEQSRATAIAPPSTSHFNEDIVSGFCGWRGTWPDYRLDVAGAMVATRVNAGVSAIFSSTSLTGLSVHARVT